MPREFSQVSMGSVDKCGKSDILLFKFTFLAYTESLIYANNRSLALLIRLYIVKIAVLSLLGQLQDTDLLSVPRQEAAVVLGKSSTCS